MLTILASAILLLTSLALTLLRALRPRFTYFWLLSIGGAWLAWPLILFSRLEIPKEIQILTWRLGSLNAHIPQLLLDDISWTFSICIGTLVLASLLTDVVRQPLKWSNLAGTTAIAAFSLLAIISGDLISLLVSWAALDLVQLTIWTLKAQNGKHAMVAITARFASLAVICIALFLYELTPASFFLDDITSHMKIAFLLAACLRMGVIPVYSLSPEGEEWRGSLGSMSLLAPYATGLMLITRVGASGGLLQITPFWYIFLGLIAIFTSLSWMQTKDEFQGAPFWMISGSVLAVVAATRSQPAASLSWGITLLLEGGLLLLFSIRPRWLLPLLYVAVLSICALPYTPNWYSVYLFSSPNNYLLLGFTIIQGWIIAGYMLKVYQREYQLRVFERWVWVIYPWGLLLLPVTHLALFYWNRAGNIDLSIIAPNAIVSLVGIGSFSLALFTLFWMRRGHQTPARFIGALRYLVHFSWLKDIVSKIDRIMIRFIATVNLVLEGDGGIFWAMLLLILALAFISQTITGV